MRVVKDRWTSTPDAGNPPVRFDEREVETEHGMRLLRHKRGNLETEYAEAYPTAPPLDSTLFHCFPLLVAGTFILSLYSFGPSRSFLAALKSSSAFAVSPFFA
jgi:hypothetical protein